MRRSDRVTHRVVTHRYAGTARHLGALAIAALSVVSCTTNASNDNGNQSAHPTDSSAEVGFARDMSVHHAQAVAMAEAIGDRTTDPDLKLLAADIALGQQHQIGRMTGWLDEWGLTISSTNTPMVWMDVSAEMGSMVMNSSPSAIAVSMPGTATRPQISALSTLPIDQAEISFLQLMIAHHRGGVQMASAILARTKRPDVRLVANSIVKSQGSEIDLMTQMLARRGAKP